LGPGRIRVTERALEALRAEGLDPARTVLVIRHVLGCGGSGYRLSFKDRPLEDGRVLAVEGGLTLSLDEYSWVRLEGAAIDYDPEKETEGFLLDHPDAAFAAFC
jgi:Fe-S cluster assembly iron-binding protein IscA